MNIRSSDRFTKLLVITAFLGLLMGAPVTASASLWVASSSANGIAASADFEIVGGNLQIVLTNTYTGSTLDQAHVLTGVTFITTGSVTSGSAAIAAGSLLFSSSGAVAGTSGMSVNEGWGYGTAGATKGVEASGRINGIGDAFDGTALDGSAYGLLSASTSLPLQDGLPQHTPYLQNRVVITLYGTLSADVSSVDFQWGTGSGEPDLPGTPGGPPPVGSVPEPASIAVWGIVSALAAGAVSLRKQKRGRSARRWSEKDRAAIYSVVNGKTTI
jgi:hypothetical protein